MNHIIDNSKEGSREEQSQFFILTKEANITDNLKDKILSRLAVIFDDENCEYNMNNDPDIESWKGVLRFFELYESVYFPTIILRIDGKFETIWWRKNRSEVSITFNSRVHAIVRFLDLRKQRFFRIISPRAKEFHCGIEDIHRKLDKENISSLVFINNR